MEAKRYLEEYKKIDIMILNKTIEAEQWESLANSITVQSSGERVQSSGNPQRMQEYICNKINIEEEIDALIARKKDITDTIALLPIAEYDILHKVYIQFKDLKEVQLENNTSYSWITTIHGRALQQLQEILNERKSANVV